MSRLKNLLLADGGRCLLLDGTRLDVASPEEAQVAATRCSVNTLPLLLATNLRHLQTATMRENFSACWGRELACEQNTAQCPRDTALCAQLQPRRGLCLRQPGAVTSSSPPAIQGLPRAALLLSLRVGGTRFDSTSRTCRREGLLEITDVTQVLPGSPNHLSSGLQGAGWRPQFSRPTKCKTGVPGAGPARWAVSPQALQDLHGVKF